ncbi:hypothetical protein ASPCAL03003 [Aspergillus calidoustus]|uniref:Uncharacterized protein n=1 Tax=Aspergillus calidoustus TaxID=454130 RepID=A0A0U5GTX7_ASPCI|nr:hypothetical protein ASPCAL03003 [Aspergillus calidoustus]
MPRSLSHAEFGVGWICALPLELAAATEMLDVVYENLPVQPSDHNTYTLGRIGAHKVVIACLPSGEYGIASAATVAMNMLSSFQSVKIGLLVGIGGGIPSHTEDIRLGDVVVGVPTSSNTHGGVIQYDLGKAGHGDKFKRTGMLNRPPQTLLTAVSKLQAIHQMEGNQISSIMKEAAKQSLALRTVLEAPQREDLLFETSYTHDQKEPTCRGCNPERIIGRPPRVPNQPRVHYGLIASGNRVVKDSHFRNRLSRDLGACCVEMEAAGLMNNFPCLVVRGICDYADSHKNKDWQGYAAAVAAAYAKELLLVAPSGIDAVLNSHLGRTPNKLDKTRSTAATISESLKKRILSSLLPSTIDLPYSGQTYHVDCAWDDMLGHDAYNTWYQGQETCAHRGLIWIKGKPGSGKSSFLKFAFSRAVENLQRDGSCAVGFFFHPLNQHLHWTQLDLFQIIIYELLQYDHDRLVNFMKAFGRRFEDSKKRPCWSIEELKSFLKTAFTKHRTSRTVIFVDGIDECEGDGMRELAIFFREITAASHVADAKLSICLSSREYPKVSIGECPEVLIDRHNIKEIRRYIDRKLATAGLEGHEQWVKLTTCIVDRSAGVILWAVIVMDTLLQDWDNGKNFRYLKQRLKEIPPALEQLYNRILSTAETQDLQMTLKFFYWVVLAAKPLRLLEWHHVIAWIRDKPPESLQEWRESDYYDENTWQLERQIQIISKGLVEVNTSPTQQAAIERNSTHGDAGSLNSEEGEARTVRVIHSSVAEFFFRGKGFFILDPALRSQSRALAVGHLSILSTCLDYIAIPELDVLAQGREKVDRLISHRQTHRPRGARSEASFGSSASSYTGSARSDHYDWNDADNNVFSTHLLPPSSDSVTKSPPLAGGSLSVPPTMPFALQQYLQSIPQIDLSVLERAASDIESHKSETKLSQTLQEYPDFLLYTINAFAFHAKYADEYKGDPGHILRRLRAENLWRRWICLADKFSWDTTLLHFAAELSLVSWINCLLLMGADPDETGREYQYPLMAAVVNHHKEATRILVKWGANAVCGNKISKSPLHYIAEEGSTEFLDYFLMNMPAQNPYHAKLLYARDDLRRTPLHLAAQKGHLSMCKKLLELGADPNCYDYGEKCALHYAAESEESSMAVCQLLLENGALRDASTDELLTPGQLALQNGHLDRLALIEDYSPGENGHSHSASTTALEVRLVEFLGKSRLKHPYIQLCFADQKKTLYPAKSSPDNKTGREIVHFTITLATEEQVFLHLFDIRGSRHVRGKINWEVKYIGEKNGELETRVFMRSHERMQKQDTQAFPVSGGMVTLEVLVPPTVEITDTEMVILPQGATQRARPVRQRPSMRINNFFKRITRRALPNRREMTDSIKPPRASP